MKLALHTVVTKLRAGQLPSVMEYGAVLYEAGCDQAEARAMTAAYARDIAGHSTAEDRLMAELMSFSLG